jgi:DNA-directed RNA polymerase subunit M/transcription elongation factor TFIIS
MSQNSNKTDDIRKTVVQKFNNIIKKKSISRRIEQSIFNYIIGVAKQKNITRGWNNSIFKKLYLSKVRSIYSNLDSESYIENKTFLKRILEKQLKDTEIGRLTTQDIFPENWEKLLEEKIKRDKIKYELKPEAMTSAFKCRKCGSRETSYYEVQTRSADEPMTQFITCLNCYNHWKQ